MVALPYTQQLVHYILQQNVAPWPASASPPPPPATTAAAASQLRSTSESPQLVSFKTTADQNERLIPKAPSSSRPNKQPSNHTDPVSSPFVPNWKPKSSSSEMSAHGAAEDQLLNYKKSLKEATGFVTTGTGAPIGTRDATQTAGPHGPALLQDVNFVDELAHFGRERIPERVVHAKGGGAFGYFEVTHDTLRPFTGAKVFESVGKRTPMAARFSTVGGESGSADTARDPRGFALKFYTDDGIWDLVGNNTPIFFIRDPILFPSFIHTQKRNPATHLKDPNAVWDFFTLRPESTHQMMVLFSDRGTPDGFRYMNGYGSHTFTLVNAAGKQTYVKFHFKTDQGIRNLSAQRADELAGSDPDYAIRDLYNAIARGDHPSWTLKVQLMSVEEAAKVKFNPFDVTKVWPQADFPLKEVGRFTLDRNPSNYFAEVEQIALSPANLVPGIEASPDKMLQGRLFSYSDTQRYRLGPNHLQLPVNCPYRVQPKNYQRDGPMCFTDNHAGAPNYFPNSFGGPVEEERVRKLQPPTPVLSKCPAVEAHRYSTADEDNYSQPAVFFNKVLNADERTRLIDNISGHLAGAATFIQERAVKNFANVSTEFSSRIAKNLGLKNAANL